MPKYKCYRCNYTSDIKSHIYNHFLKKNKCFENINSLKYNNDQIIKYSLCKNKNNYEKFVNKTSKYNVSKTTSEFIEELKQTYKNKIKVCKFCNQNFEKYAYLEYHLFECIEIIDDNNDKSNHKNNITINNNEENNIVNNNINNINNNINNNNYFIKLNCDKKNIVSFDDEWSTDHINIDKKICLFLSTFKFTKTLETILENDINRNVLLSDDNKKCIIYKGDEENEFYTLKSDEIFNKSITKLYKHLKDFENEIIENNNKEYVLDKEIINKYAKITDSKIDNYKLNNNTKESVNNLISNIFNKHKDDIKDKYIEVSNDDNKMHGF
jgi:hypothetical protein